jgi:hypothetical protein
VPRTVDPTVAEIKHRSDCRSRLLPHNRGNPACGCNRATTPQKANCKGKPLLFHVANGMVCDVVDMAETRLHGEDIPCIFLFEQAATTGEPNHDSHFWTLPTSTPRTAKSTLSGAYSSAALRPTQPGNALRCNRFPTTQITPSPPASTSVPRQARNAASAWPSLKRLGAFCWKSSCA